MTKTALLFVWLFSPFVLLAAETRLDSAEDLLVFSTKDAVYVKVIDTEEYQTTCSEEVSDGTTTECETRTENRCRKISGVGEECWKEPIEICSEVPATRTVTYSCTQIREVVRYEYDHDIIGSVEVKLPGNRKDFNLENCKLGAKLTENNNSLSANCLTAIVKGKITHVGSKKVGRDEYRAIKAEVTLAEISDLKATLFPVRFDTYKGGKIVNFSAANLSLSENKKIKLFVKRHRFLLKDKVLVNKEISLKDLTTVQEAEDQGKYQLNLKNWLGDFDDSKKHTVEIIIETKKPIDLNGAINTPGLSNRQSDSLIINR